MSYRPNFRLIEYIPLQQGLRHLLKHLLFQFLNTHWVYSITTRIKTHKRVWNMHFYAHWVYSITTRIKTIYFPVFGSYTCFLIEYIPLQQGLRLHSHCLFFNVFYLIEYIPLQQGLRLQTCKYSMDIVPHWVYSITTRIKTAAPYTPVFALRSSLSIFHYNKD